MAQNNIHQYLGNIGVGRSHLGEEMPVVIYRLFEFTMKDVLLDEYGEEKCNELFRQAGKRAGEFFVGCFLNKDQEFSSYIAQVQKLMIDMKIGILRIEEMDNSLREMTLTVSEDLDCSGLPITGKTVCHYDEGFISGVLECYTQKQYHVKEIDCWSKGDRVCRFLAKRDDGDL